MQRPAQPAVAALGDPPGSRGEPSTGEEEADPRMRGVGGGESLARPATCE